MPRSPAASSFLGTSEVTSCFCVTELREVLQAFRGSELYDKLNKRTHTHVSFQCNGAHDSFYRCIPTRGASRRTTQLSGSKKTQHDVGPAAISHASHDRFLICPRFDTART
ncbi:hypothetical protein NDU88_003174 [Pleurodeles waltl]|uniref:Uncharacterized protein n=1 Tax=Pleurodeles waltl TaxID=8319 RepID=A0AAV7T5D1_PLEWA|nr:hypothetical protein NDU88_003174 [Pleurodeles waltl]